MFELRIGEPDGQFQPRMVIIVRMNVHIHDASENIGTVVADAPEHALNDVDVMLSAIQVHADR